MIRINQLKLPIDHTPNELHQKAAKILRVTVPEIRELKIIKQSVDARKKPALFYSYTVDIAVDQEEKVLHRSKAAQVVLQKKQEYQEPQCADRPLKYRPVVVGSGPAGLFCALTLARYGYQPIVLERGEDVDQRLAKVTSFWQDGQLDTQSNVQFGEGGAGTFSDGKLNTLVKDVSGRNRKVLDLFVEFGADPAILYQNKPHLGTDHLSVIVKNMRQEILACGGTVQFSSQVTDLLIENNQMRGVIVNDCHQIATNQVILAIGHSARDTFEMLLAKTVPMEAKAFAVGLRIQHPQILINQSQYGHPNVPELGAASYKLTRQTKTGRGVYSFCMCPGGYVVDASSEREHLSVNGMSYHARSETNANSAIIATVTPADFEVSGCLGGMYYQRKLEATAYQLGAGKIPIQLYGDFKASQETSQLGNVAPDFKGNYSFANLNQLFNESLRESLIEGIESFGTVIPGFQAYDAVLAGVESRTSSPVRINRDERMQSTKVEGLYPCGEGAGYAGGITSAAMDGLKTAEMLIQSFAPLS